MRSLSVILMVLSFTCSAQWNVIEVNQIGITASNSLMNASCSWWLMDGKNQRVGNIATVAINDTLINTSFQHYYDLQNVGLMQSGLIHADSIYQGCLVCGGTDTLEADLIPVGDCAEIDHAIYGSWIGVDSMWSGSVYWVDSLIWDPGLRIAANIQNTLWSGQSYNYTNFGQYNPLYGLKFAFIYQRKYAIFILTCNGGYLNYKVINLITGDVIYKTGSFYLGEFEVETYSNGIKKINYGGN